MGRAYLHSEVLRAKADEIRELLEEFKLRPDFNKAVEILVDIEKSLRIMSTDWRLPEELYNTIAKRLNKKRTVKVSDAIKLLEEWVEEMRHEFDEWWEDKDEPRQFHI